MPEPNADRARRTLKVRTTWRYRLASSIVTAAIMSSVIGGFLALVRTGPDGWLPAFASGAPLGFLVALPTSLLVVPAVQRMVDGAFGLEPAE